MQVLIFLSIICYIKSDNTTSVNSNVPDSLNTTRIPVNFTCKTSYECNNNGLCNTTLNICLCDIGYDTLIIQNSTNSKSMCNYQKKSQLTTLMLSIFVGFGAEHFYLENIPLAASKFFFYLFCYGLNLILLVLYKCSDKYKKYVEFISEVEYTYLVCAFISIVLWNIYDWVNIANNNYLDSNKISLKPW